MKLLRLPSSQRSSSGFLSTAELREAVSTLIRLVQVEELLASSKGQPVAKGSRVRWYNPLIRKDQLLQLGGRLKHSLELEEAKNPLALPRTFASCWTTADDDP